MTSPSPDNTVETQYAIMLPNGNIDDALGWSDDQDACQSRFIKVRDALLAAGVVNQTLTNVTRTKTTTYSPVAVHDSTVVGGPDDQ